MIFARRGSWAFALFQQTTKILSRNVLKPRTMTSQAARHWIASAGVVGAICAGNFFHTVVAPSPSSHGDGVFLINAVWGLYYGLGFEPAFVWYKIHGPYPSGFLDLLPLIYFFVASVFLYWVYLKLTLRPAWRKWVIVGLTASFLVIVPMHIAPMADWWMHPMWVFGVFSEPP